MLIKSIVFRVINQRILLLIAFMICSFLLIAYPWEMGVIFRYGFGTAILISATLYVSTYSCQHRVGTLIGLISVFALYFLTLFSLWGNGFGEMQVLGGGIFFSDTFLFLSEANSLIDGGSFYSIASRRPLFSSFFSSLLFLTGRNLQLSLMLLVAINALAIYLIGEEIKKMEGFLSAAIISTLLFLFYRRFIGMPDTENYGTMLGVVGFSLLLNTGAKNRLTRNLFGLFTITLGLLGRAGAFLVLAGILIWMVSNQKTFKTKIVVLGFGIVVVLIGFLSNFVLSRAVNKTSGTLFANYSETIYGISVGGKGWQQAYQDYPEFTSIPETIRSKMLYRLALLNMYQHPFLTLRSVLDSWTDFFSLKNDSVFGFASGGELIFRNSADADKKNVYMVWRVLLYGLSIVGLLKCWKNRQDPRYKLILFCLIGTFFSIPFLPPRDSALMRVYAGTISSIVIVPAIGFGCLFKPVPLPRAGGWSTTNIAIGLSIFLIIATFVGPIFLKQSVYLPDFASPHCVDGLALVIVRVIPGSVVNIIPDSQPHTAVPLVLARATFINSIEDFPQKEYVLPLRKLMPPAAIANVFDIRTRKYFWMIVHDNLFIRAPQIVGACGIWNRELTSSGLNFFETNDIYFLQE